MTTYSRPRSAVSHVSQVWGDRGALRAPQGPIQWPQGRPSSVSSHSSLHFALETPLKLLFTYSLSSPDLALKDGKVSELPHSFVRPALDVVPGTFTKPVTFGQLNLPFSFLDLSQVGATLVLNSILDFHFLSSLWPTTRGMLRLWLSLLEIKGHCPLISLDTRQRCPISDKLLSMALSTASKSRTSAPTLNFLALRTSSQDKSTEVKSVTFCPHRGRERSLLETKALSLCG